MAITPGMIKVKEGLVLLIDGLLDDTLDLMNTNRTIKGTGLEKAFMNRFLNLDGYFRDAATYNVDKENVDRLHLKYSSVKDRYSKLT